MDGWMDGWMDVDDGRWMVLLIGAVARASIAIDRGRVMVMMTNDDA